MRAPGWSLCSILALWCGAVLATDSTINIDISIGEAEEVESSGRDTTSTVYKAGQDKFEKTPEEEESEGCGNKTVGLGAELQFGPRGTNVIPARGNLSWSAENIRNIGCVTEFVVMLRAGDNATSPATVLCPGYEVRSSGSEFWCEYELEEETFCGTRVYIMLESWSENRMLQPSTVVTVRCQEEEEEEAAEDATWQLPLVLASLRVFSDVTRNKTGVKDSGKDEDEDSDPEQGGEGGGVLSLGCSWTEWGAWAECSISCGGRGTRVRRRAQTGSRVCQGAEQETTSCQTNLCPVDCEVSGWAAWSPCSTSCGLGSRSRRREVVREAANWGNKCPTNLVEVQPCEEEDCKVDGGWSGWSRWGYCSESCGRGSRSRSRSCSEPAPQHGGEQCQGPRLETKDCYLKTCPPVDGGWAAWSRWSACTHTCGWGSQRRVRSCTRPAAAHGGRECAGDRIQNNKCMLRRCPDTELEAARDLDDGNATISVNDAARSEVIPEPTRTRCPPPPEVLGFLTPVPLGLNTTDVTNSNLTSVEILPGLQFEYTCSRGRVLDTRTNRRTFSVTCGGGRAGPGAWQLPDTWPSCRRATHCVGRAARPGAEHGVYPGVPRRDAPVNTAVRYTCRHDTQLSLHAGCFYDGRYRYHPSWPSCADTGSEVDLCSEAAASATSDVIIAVPRLTETSHGWLTSPGYPALSNRSSSCSWSLAAPHGFVLAVGVEEVRGFPAPANTTARAAVELSQGTAAKQLISVEDVGRTYFTVDNVVTVKSIPGFEKAWKLSYLVVEPT